MNICIVGDGLTSLSLAKNLINKNINVHIYKKKRLSKLPSGRTIGITKNNLKFFTSEIQKIEKNNIWGINKIEIFSEKMKENKILNFERKESNLFYMIKNNDLYKLLKDNLLKSKFYKEIQIKKNDTYKNILNKNYDLIINSDSNNLLAKKYFSKRIDKNYENIAYTTILKHEKIMNQTAIQIFTEFGPIAFLPISDVETSVVYSLETTNKKFKDEEVIDLINRYNPKFRIKKILKLDNFKLKSSNLRNYHYKNILAFGDSNHRIHPLAGQGFNMTIFLN